MADLETQIRSLADRRFADTEPVELSFAQIHPSPARPLRDARASTTNEVEMIMRSNHDVPPRRRWYLIGAAAGLVAITAVGVALMAGNDPESTSVAEQVPAPTLSEAEPVGDDPPAPEANETSGPAASSPEGALSSMPDVAEFGADSALALVTDYFAARNSGDIDAVFAMFTTDATYSDNWTTTIDRDGWEPMFAWDIAQGERLISPECQVVYDDPGEFVSVSCEYGTLDAVGVAVEAATIPTTATLSISPAGIGMLHEEYGKPDFSTTGNPFSTWMEENHPEDVDATDCCGGDTVEESIARAELRVRYAAEFADHIDASGCDYRTVGC